MPTRVDYQQKERRYGLEKEIRLASFVPRWAIMKTLRTQTLADHQWHVQQIAVRMVKDLDLERYEGVDLLNIMTEASTHDLEELISGDIPSPVNKRVKLDSGWKPWLQSVVRTFFPWYKEEPVGYTKPIVQIADLTEAILFLIEEEELGNRYVKPCEENLRVLLKNAIESAKWPESDVAHQISHWCNASFQKAVQPARIVGDVR